MCTGQRIGLLKYVNVYGHLLVQRVLLKFEQLCALEITST